MEQIQVQKNLEIVEKIIEETEYTGVVYCVTNIENGKQYIGQAKSYIQNHGNQIRHGHIGRFNEHIKEALNDSDDCIKFYNSIRKYGKDSFKVELLLICKLEDLLKNETAMIKSYDTVKKGYNIMSSGYVNTHNYDKNLTRIQRTQKSMIERWKDPEYIEKTTKANLKSSIKRAESGKTRKKEDTLELPANIYRTTNGFVIQIMRNRVLHRVFVVDVNLSEKDKLKLAVDKLTEIKSKFPNIDDTVMEDSKIADVDYDSDDDTVNSKTTKTRDHDNKTLPMYIGYCKIKDRVGYRVRGTIGKCSFDKYFMASTKTMDEKLISARNALNEIQNKLQLEELEK